MSADKADIARLVKAISHFLSREAESPGCHPEVYLRVVPEGDLAALLVPKGGKLRIVIDALPEGMSPAVLAAEMGYPSDHPCANPTVEDFRLMPMPEATV